jgi:hypothetical protein
MRLCGLLIVAVTAFLLGCDRSKSEEATVAEFNAAFERFEQSQYIVDFKVEDDNGTWPLRITQVDGEQLWRLGPSEDDDEVIFVGDIAGEPTLCRVDDRDGERVCVEGDYSGTLPLFFLPSPANLQDLLDGDTSDVKLTRSSKRIAGLDAECFKASTAGGGMQVCFGPNGEFVGGSAASTLFGGSLDAQSVTSDATPSDVQIPYRFVEVPGY